MDSGQPEHEGGLPRAPVRHFQKLEAAAAGQHPDRVGGRVGERREPAGGVLLLDHEGVGAVLLAAGLSDREASLDSH